MAQINGATAWHGIPKISQATAHFVAIKAGSPGGKRFFRIQLEQVGHGGCLISRSHDVYNTSGQSRILLAMVSAPLPLTMAFTTVSKKQTLYPGSVRRNMRSPAIARRPFP